MPAALAIAAHPDDIEFVMAGSLLMLKKAGWEIHCINVANGNMGSTIMSAAETAQVRRDEAQEAARVLKATWHEPFCSDMLVFYNEENLRKLTAVVREVAPEVIFTHALQDYMEDHMTVARLAVSAAFARGIPNFESIPRRDPVMTPCVIYHAMPHGQRSPLREPVTPELLVNTTSVHQIKREALACHASQKEWLDATQGQESYLDTMAEFSLNLGRQSKAFLHAEGWTRHLHYGFSTADHNPLKDVLGEAYKETENQ